jgi:hypothetical protein
MLEELLWEVVKMLIKDRTVEFQIYDLTNDVVADSIKMFIKTINYDIEATGSVFKGITFSDTLQWYSSIFKFEFSGDSYINPFKIPTFISDDNQYPNFYQMYLKYFFEGDTFELGRYKFRFDIYNCPLRDELFEGVLTGNPSSETDEELGLMSFNFTFEAKSVQHGTKQSAKSLFSQMLNLGS